MVDLLPSLLFYPHEKYPYGGDRSLADPRGIGKNVGEFAINFLRRRKMMVYRLVLNEKGFEITYNGRKL